ncbi:vacuolar protein sorting-associated protein 33B [Planococcus citri]|uniref:vacuolar protein sorting-associated protein 33B n=1 Tax=Planococcus citri TaxID=170843 RepID=UPI0031F8E01A
MKSKIPVLSLLSREKLTNILSKIPGKKDLIIDPKIIKPLENIVGISVLRSLDVDKVYKIQGSNILSTKDTRVFLIYTDLVLVKHICDHINAEVSKNEKSRTSFYLILVPRKLFSVMQLLEEEGVYERVTVFSLHWELIPLDNNSILSLEMKNFFSYLFVNGDQSFLPVAAKSIWSTFFLWGNPCTRICIGNHSQSVSKMINTYFEELGRPQRNNSDIDCCIIVDRDVDYMSTLLTPATYTSLLDEVFRIQSGFVEINDGLMIPLNNQDIYLQIRNRHFSHVTSFLKDKARTIQGEYEKSQKMKLEEIKQYVKKDLVNITEQKKSLSHHISACEIIVKKLGEHFEKFVATEEGMLENASKYETINFIEDCIAMDNVDKFSILRLMCLLSITQNGLTLEEVNKLKSLFINAYGYNYLPIFYNLEKLGLFTIQQAFTLSEVTASSLANKVAQVVPLSSKKSPFHQMVQKLKLIPNHKEPSNFKDPSDMSYVFSGSYIPAVCQLVNLLHSGEMVKDDVPKFFSNAKVQTSTDTNALNTFFIYFIGGVTYAEVAAFQLFEKLTGCQVLIGASNIINGNIICESCL